MVTKSRTPRPPEPPKAPLRPKRKKLTPPRTARTAATATDMRREAFVAAYMADPKKNAAQAAIKAGYSPHSAYAQGSRLLKDRKVLALMDQMHRQVLQPLVDQFEVNAQRLQRELAKLAFSNVLDFGTLDGEGGFIVDLSQATRDQASAIQSIKTKRTTRTVGDTDIEDVVTEFRLAPKREALVELAKMAGMYKEGADPLLQVRFIMQWGPGPKPEPYPDEIEAFASAEDPTRFEPYVDEGEAA